MTILCYHDPAPDVLANHLRWLRRHYNVIGLRDYMEWRKQRPELRVPPKAMIITLDDGHKGNLALEPIFRSARVPVTIFLCSAIVGTNRHYWWKKVPAGEARILKRVPDEQRCSRLAALGFDERREHDSRQALSSDEVGLLKPIADFQAHTRLHPILPMCSRDRVADEIGGCKVELEYKFGLRVYAIAYPNGDYSEREIEAIRAAGYECALTLDGGYNTLKTDVFRLRRIGVDDNADLHELVVKASGLWDVVLTILQRREYGYQSRDQ